MELGLNNYEINKQLMANEKPIDPILLSRKLQTVAASLHLWRYGMLLCRERNDYTIFHSTENSTAAQTVRELKETLEPRGKVVDIDERKDGTFEIWIRDNDEDVLYMFFDCMGFIVEC